ncbi:MAG: DUF4296 domain-containing protein [Bacteroidales bacterium]|nr:DUF4296 domain-containing protein [Bacteroidales bacterium]
MIKRCPVILTVLVLLLAGCAEKGVIPPRKMASILHDMYILDAQLEYARDYSAMADTSAVYGSLFNEYGYSIEDFNRSLDYYLHNPVQFKEIFKIAHDRYENEAKALEAKMVEKDEIPVPDEPASKPPRGRRNRQGVDELELEETR